MKEAMGGITIFQIVILFILLFTGIMCLTINHSKAFAVKDELITLLENSETSNGRISDDVLEQIVQKLQDAGYRTTGKCPDDTYIGYNRNGVATSRNVAFCIRPVSVSSTYINDVNNKCSRSGCIPLSDRDFPNMGYYDVVLFYRLDIPFIGDIFNLGVSGSTRTMFG